MHSLNRLNYCEKKKCTEIIGQTGPGKPSFGFQINNPLKKLKKLGKKRKKGKFLLYCILAFLVFSSFFK